MATLRKLGALETSLDIRMSKVECMYVQVFVVRSAETIDESRMADAAQAWSMRHPLLRACIETRPDGRYFVQMESSECKSAIHFHENIPDWVALAENELIQPVGTNRGRLWRINYGRTDSDKYVFMFTVHHAITDAVNFILAGFELLTILNGKEDTLPPAESDVSPCIEQILFKTEFYDGPPPVVDVPWVIPGKKIPPSFHDPENDKGICRLLPFELDAESTNRLLQQSKQHGVKLNATLCCVTALAQAMLYDAHNEDIGQTIIFRTTVNLRPFLKLDNHNLFLCVTNLLVRAFLKSNLEESLANFWNITKDMSDNFYERLEREAIETSKVVSLYLKQPEIRVGVFDPSHFIVSNAGAFSYLPVGIPNEVVVEEVYFTTSLLHDSPVVPNFGTVTTLNGRLFWCLAYHEKVIKTELAREFRKLIVDLVHQLVNRDH